jgi:hypothetical protein
MLSESQKFISRGLSIHTPNQVPLLRSNFDGNGHLLVSLQPRPWKGTPDVGVMGTDLSSEQDGPRLIVGIWFSRPRNTVRRGEQLTLSQIAET